MNRLATVIDPSPGYAHYTDRVPSSELPRVPHFEATGSFDVVKEYLELGICDRHRAVQPREIRASRPPAGVSTMNDAGINFELLASMMGWSAQNRFDSVTRMGASFESYEFDARDVRRRSPRTVQLYAMQVMGLDAALGEHSLEQLRRADQAVKLQETLLIRVLTDIHATYGNKRATLKAADQIYEQVRPIGIRSATLLRLCGLLHDFGEAYTRHDTPLNEKTKTDAVYEGGHCIDYANKVYGISNAPKIQTMLQERVAKADCPDAAVIRMRYTHAGYYLHPREITDALAGTEHQAYGNVTRGHMFKSIELVEYVLSGIRALEAVEYNFANINQKTPIVPKLLRLGVDTFINHVEDLTRRAEQYPFVYDFLRQNEARLDRYTRLVMNDIEQRAENPDDEIAGVFGVDPFLEYGTDSFKHMSKDQAKQRYREVTAYWQAWRRKNHVMRALWETYLGTAHPLTAHQRDVSFLQYTAQTATTHNGLVVVDKPLTDMWGQGIDERSREERASKIQQKFNVLKRAG